MRVIPLFSEDILLIYSGTREHFEMSKVHIIFYVITVLWSDVVA